MRERRQTAPRSRSIRIGSAEPATPVTCSRQYAERNQHEFSTNARVYTCGTAGGHRDHQPFWSRCCCPPWPAHASRRSASNAFRSLRQIGTGFLAYAGGEQKATFAPAIITIRPRPGFAWNNWPINLSVNGYLQFARHAQRNRWRHSGWRDLLPFGHGFVFNGSPMASASSQARHCRQPRSRTRSVPGCWRCKSSYNRDVLRHLVCHEWNHLQRRHANVFPYTSMNPTLAGQLPGAGLNVAHDSAHYASFNFDVVPPKIHQHDHLFLHSADPRRPVHEHQQQRQSRERPAISRTPSPTSSSWMDTQRASSWWATSPPTAETFLPVEPEDQFSPTAIGALIKASKPNCAGSDSQRDTFRRFQIEIENGFARKS